MSPLKWTNKSTRTLAEELARSGPPDQQRHRGALSGGDGVYLAGECEDPRGIASTRTGMPSSAT